MIIMKVYHTFYLILLYTVQISCDLEVVEVSIYSFSNFENRLASSERCCDLGSSCSVSTCDSFFRFCLRSNNSFVSNDSSGSDVDEVCATDEIVSTQVMRDTDSFDFSNTLLTFKVTTTDEISIGGLQLFAELLDADFSNPDDLIDRFAIEIDFEIPLQRSVYEGVFGVAEVDLAYRVESGNIICAPEFNELLCGENQRCVDGVDDYTCECEPGYTGPDCLTLINCVGVNCSGNGECESTENSFQCNCQPIYTGQFCESQLNGYELLVTINSYSNPDHRCADCGCCDADCGSGRCDTFFFLCVRPYQSQFTNVTDTRQGNCLPNEVVTTTTDFDSDGDTFTNFVLNVPNPIRFSRIPNPIGGIQLYLELIDDDFNNDELIDRYVLDVNISVGTTLTMPDLRGIFNITVVDIRFEAQCMSGFTGDYCTEVINLQQRNDDDDTTILAIIVAATGFVILSLLGAVVVMCIVFVKQRLKKRQVPVSNLTLIANDNESEDVGYAALDGQYHALRHNQVDVPRRPKYYDIHGKSAEGPTANYERLNNTDAAKSPRPPREVLEMDEMIGSFSYAYATSPVTLSQSLHQMKDQSRARQQEYTYWQPSGREDELMNELKLLKLKIFKEHELEFQDNLGHGAFAEVSKGLWYSRDTEYSEIREVEVAIKSLKRNASEGSRIKFLQEAAIMGQFDHPYIVHIYGILATKEKYHIIVELMANGSLLQYLRNIPPGFDKTELRSHMLCYSRQIANGMEYLRIRGYIHRDLAARNILLSGENTCKISDFGLSRGLHNDDDFYLSSGGKVPVKWTAPEALQYNLYSSASDAWSYGIVLYEIWSLGGRPYNHLTNEQVGEQLSTGYRLPPPPGCPREVYKIMIQCWHSDAGLRPKFMEVIESLNQPEFKILKWSPEDVQAYDLSARTIGAPLMDGKYLFTELQETYKAESLVPFL